MAFTRQRILERLRDRIAAGQPIIGGGAGNGISAKCQEAGGVDLLVIYNSGRFRMNGRGSLAGCMPYGDANAIVMEMAGDVLPVVPQPPGGARGGGPDPPRRSRGRPQPGGRPVGGTGGGGGAGRAGGPPRG